LNGLLKGFDSAGGRKRKRSETVLSYEGEPAGTTLTETTTTTTTTRTLPRYGCGDVFHPNKQFKQKEEKRQNEIDFLSCGKTVMTNTTL
jgi:hypothetical protein